MGVLVLALLILTEITPSEATIVYATDFETGAGPEWSSTGTEVTPVGARQFLGSFANQTVTLTLADLPAHTSITVSFDLFLISSWDGNGDCCCGPDVFDLSLTACIAKAQLDEAFAKADEEGPCWDGQGFQWSLVTEAATGLATLLYPPGLNSQSHFECATAKLKLASKLAFKKANCHAKATKKAAPVEAACLQKVDATFAAGFQEIEATGGCGTNGDMTAAKAFVDQFVTSALELLTMNELPIRCCSASATVTLPIVGTVNVSGCTDMLIGTCSQAATLPTSVGGSATPGAPGTVCNGQTGSCQAARTGTSTCCQAEKNGLQICAEGPSLATVCSAANGQGGVSFSEYPGRICKDHYPGPPTCDP